MTDMNNGINGVGKDASNDAELQAKAQFDSIAEMLARVEHINTCKGDEEECDSEYMTRVDLDDDSPQQLLWEHPELDFDEYHDEDAARNAIYEDPLSVEVRSGWHEVGGASEDEEYTILLCTGGPAVRIVGDLGEYGQPTSARLEYRDWGTPWTMYVAPWTNDREYGSQQKTLIEYASYFLGQ